MKHINFIKKQTLFDGEASFNYLFVLIVSLGLLASFLVYSLVQNARLRIFEEKMANLTEVLSTGNYDAGEVKIVSSSLVHSLNRRIYWSGLIRDVSQQVTSSLWLLSINGGWDQKGTVEIEGLAVDSQVVARYQERLEENSLLRRVFLLSSEEEEKDGKKRFHFKLKAEIE